MLYFCPKFIWLLPDILSVSYSIIAEVVKTIEFVAHCATNSTGTHDWVFRVKSGWTLMGHVKDDTKEQLYPTTSDELTKKMAVARWCLHAWAVVPRALVRLE